MTGINLTELNVRLPADFDLFILSASYESRSLTCAKSIRPGIYKSAMIAWNENHREYNRENMDRLQQLCSGVRIVPCSLDSDNPVATADAFAKGLESAQLHGTSKILLDVTAFTREGLAILLRVLKLYLDPQTNITVIYNPAQKYDNDQDRPHLTFGIREIRSVLGYSGGLNPSKPSHLIVLPGYEHDRAAELIASYEPRLLSIGRIPKDESISVRFYALQNQFANSLSSIYSRNHVRLFKFSAKDINVTKNAVLKQVAKFGAFTPVVAAMNSKLATVGACLAALSNEDIQLCYAQPKRYNIESFSDPSAIAYICEIALGGAASANSK
jgi:hypothetical protein